MKQQLRALIVVNGIAMLLALGANAQTCANFPAAGRYVNVRDGGQGEVHIKISSDCKSLTVLDNAGLEWKVDLSGVPTTAPVGYPFLADPKSPLTYSATLVGPNTIKIQAQSSVKINDLGFPLFQVNAQIAYEAVAVFVPNGSDRGSIRLFTESVRLLAVQSSGIIGGQTSGFVQGANFIMNLTKNILDADLRPL